MKRLPLCLLAFAMAACASSQPPAPTITRTASDAVTVEYVGEVTYPSDIVGASPVEVPIVRITDTANGIVCFSSRTMSTISCVRK
jgi:hypothetical protein